MKAFGTARREFWEKVFCVAVRNSYEVEIAATVADTALKLWEERWIARQSEDI